MPSWSESPEARGAQYSETLDVPVSWWLLGLLFIAAVTWAFFVATPLIVTVVAAAVTAVPVVFGLRRYGAARVATDPDGFTAGRALLPYRHVGQVAALDAVATRSRLGVEADARAYLLVRAYCRGSVQVMVDDRDDPTPYWLVSTRHPDVLAARLTARAMRD
jgi:hypothetical protein